MEYLWLFSQPKQDIWLPSSFNNGIYEAFFPLLFGVLQPKQSDETKQMNQEMRQSISCSPKSDYFTQAQNVLKENLFPLLLHIKVCLWVLGSNTTYVEKK